MFPGLGFRAQNPGLRIKGVKEGLGLGFGLEGVRGMDWV